MSIVYPERPEDLTAELVAAALEEAGVLGSVQVAAVEVEPVAEAGEAAQTVRLSVAYVEEPPADAPRSLIAKFGSSHPAMREITDAGGAYRREARLYAELADDLGVPVPRPYYAGYDPERHNFLLLLEDLAGSRVGSIFTTSVEDVERGLREVAAMHARWCGAPRLDRTRWLFSLQHPAVLGFWAQQTEQILPALRDGRFYAVNAHMLSALDRFVRKPETLLEPDAGRPETLIHGDYHPQNLFFASDVGRFAVIDWQLTQRGDGFYDAARLITFGLPTEVRRRTEGDLLDVYVDALAAAGHTVDPDEVWLRYRSALLRNSIQMVFLLASVNPESFHRRDPKTGARFSDASVGRLLTAAEEHAVGTLLR